jgi:hypothetical protein
MTDKTEEQLADEAVELFNTMSDKFAEQAGRPATKEELEYIREKVMLHIFGFYAREEVTEEPEDVQSV